MCTQTVLTTMLCRKCGSPMSNTTTTTTTPCVGAGSGGGGGGGPNSSSSNNSSNTCPHVGKTITKTAKSGKVCGACTLEEVRIYTGSF